MVKNPLAKAGDVRDADLTPGSGRSPGGGYGNPLHYFCMENPMERGAWWSTVHRFTKSWTQLKRLSMHAYMNISVSTINCEQLSLKRKAFKLGF